ncbi:MAG: MBG domain-containing protein [Bacilli bacterium]|nr:MBG domain-containing protein [Bacilli bacterium]
MSYLNNGQIDSGTYKVVAHFSDSTGNYVLPEDMTANLVINQASYSTSGFSFNDASYTYDGTEKDLVISGDLPEGVTVSYTSNKLTDAGSIKVTASFIVDSNHAPISPMTATLTVSKASFTGVSFSGSTVTYDDKAHSLSITGTLPDGVTVSYSNNGKTDSGVYDVVAHFSDSQGNYNLPDDMTAKLTISKADYDMSGISFADISYTYDGTEKTVVISGNLPSGVSVTYKDNSLTAAGSIKATASFKGDANHNAIADLNATLTIAKSTIAGISFTGASYVYDGSAHSLAITGTLPSGVTVSYTDNGQTDAGTYSVTAHFSDSTGNYVLPADMTAKLVINQASYDASGLSFNDVSYTYDGTEKTITVSGTLPEGVTVSYTNNTLTNVGSVNATAAFAVDSNHKAIPSMNATLTISKASIAAISFSGVTVTYDGTAHSLAITGTLPSGVTVSYTDNGQTDSGTYEVVAHFTDSTGNYNVPSDMTAKLIILKASYSMLGVTFDDVSYTYDGTEKTITVTGTLPEGVTVIYSSNKLTNAGSILATAAFVVDANHNAIDSMQATLTIAKASISGVSFSGSTVTYDGNAHSIYVAGTLPFGVTASYVNNGDINAGEYTVTASFADSTGNYIVPSDMTAKITITKGTYDMSGVSFDDATYTYDGTEKTLVITGTLPSGVTVSYTSNKMINAGTLTVTASFEGDSSNYNAIDSMTAVLTINKKSIDGISLTGATYVYDGTAKSVFISGTLPTGVNVTYTNNGKSDAGSYTVTACFSDTTGNYSVPNDISIVMNISKATYDMSGVTFDNVSYVYDGNEKAITVAGTLPDGVTVSYTANKLTNVGFVEVTASFTVDANHNAISEMKATLTITKASVTGISFTGNTVTYDGNSHSLAIGGALPAGVTVSYTNNGKTNAGVYTVTARFADSTGNYKVPDDMTAKLTISKKSYDMTGVSFDDATYTYDGTEKTIAITGTLPSGVTVSYTNNRLTDAGSVEATATFVGDSANYEAIPSIKATLTIGKKTVTGISLSGSTFTYDGTAKSISITGSLPSGVTVTYTNNGKTNAGTYSVTAHFADSTGNYTVPDEMTASLVISKATYDMTGVSFDSVSYIYDGTEKTLVITGTLPDGVAVSYTSNKLTNAGSLSVTAAFTGDSANYNAIDSITAVLAITKKNVTGISFSGQTFGYDGTSKSISITGTLPSGVTVSYANNGQKNVGEYTVTASFADSTGNYIVPSDMTAKITITKGTYDMSGVSFNDASYTYDGTEKTLTITGALPDGVTVSYTANKMTNAGTLTVTATFTGDSANYNAIDSMTAVLTISGQKLSAPSIDYDGEWVEWSKVTGADYYIVTINGVDTKTTDLYLSVPAATRTIEFVITCKAYGNDSANIIPSDASNTLHRFGDITNIKVANGVLTWDAIEGVEGYMLTINSNNVLVTTNSYAFADEAAGDMTVKVYAKGKDDTKSTFDGNASSGTAVTKLSSSFNLREEDDIIKWDSVAGATGYVLSLNGIEQTFDSTVTSYYVTGGFVGSNAIKVYALGDSTKYITGSYTSLLNVTKYPVPSNYKASGSKVSWDAVSGVTKYIVYVNGTEVDNGGNAYFELGDSYAAGSYTIKVKGYSSNANSVYSDYTAEITVTKIGKVSGVAVVDGVITWNSVENAASYLVTVGSNKYNVCSDKTSYVVIDASGTYEVTIQAIAEGTLLFSGSHSDTLSVTKIATPVISYANGTISWAAVEHATGYNLYINGTRVSNGTSTSYVLPIDGSASYAISVEAVGDNTYLSSMSTYSAVASIGIPSLAVSSDGVSWKAVSDATGYIIVVNGTSHYLDAAVTSYSLSGQASGDYEFQFVVVSNRSSSFSYSAEGKKTITKLATVTNIAASNGALTWDAVANATSYQITIGTGVYTASTNSLDLEGIVETGAKDISVKAIEGASYINADDSVKVSLVVLGSVANVSISEGYFTWDAVENASSYELEINGTVYEASRNLYKITDGGNYAFRVRAIGSGTYLSSPYTSLKTYTKLSVPSNIKISSGKLVWDAVTGAKSYIVNINDVDYSSASTTFLVLSSVTATLLSIKVKAVGDYVLVINSEYSAAQSLKKVAQSVISVTCGNTVSWTNTTESSVTSYTVSIGGTGGSSTNAGKVNTYAVPDEDILALSNGEHTITLIAVGSDDRLSSRADITVNVIGQVSNVVASDSNVITWEKVDGATSYDVTVNGTVNTVAQSDAPSYDLGSNALSGLTSIRAVVGSSSLSVTWTHFTVSIYKSGALYDTESVNPGDKLPSMISDAYSKEIPVAYYTDSTYSTSFSWTSDIRKDLSLYFTTDYLYYKTGESYLYYGLYPQTLVTDSALITALSALTTTDSQGYYEYQGYMYAKLSAAPCNSGYKFSDNATVITSGTTYYFKVEPIKWRILKTSGGSYTLMSEQALDNHIWYKDTSNRTISGSTVYPNNYMYSDIRSWLNADFLNKAFYLDSSLIETTAVDNSASFGNSSNSYACANTSDKVWLLSYAEATSSSYGFSTSESSSNTRCCVTTDYARAHGCWMTTNTSYYGNCFWWLRSPYIDSSYARYVYTEGDIHGSYVYTSDYGVRPALTISLS